MVGIAFLMLNIREWVQCWLCMITMVTFGENFSMPFMNSLDKQNPTANRGEYAALYTMAWSAAQTLGPLGLPTGGSFRV